MQTTKITAYADDTLSQKYYAIQEQVSDSDLETKALALSQEIKKISTDPIEYARGAPLLSQLHQDLETTIKTLAYSASHDPLTGAKNRQLHEEDGTRQLELTRRLGGHLHYILADMDEFKSINDTYGHPIGDEVLKTFVSAALETLRTGDSVYRLGGDEFCILLSSLGSTSSQDEARHVIMKINDRYAMMIDEHALPKATLSYAFASYDHDVLHIPNHAHLPARELFHYLHTLTDKRLYLAKEERGSIVGYVH